MHERERRPLQKRGRRRGDDRDRHAGEQEAAEERVVAPGGSAAGTTRRESQSRGAECQRARLYSPAIGESPIAWYAPPSLRGAVRGDVPKCPEYVPVLLPMTHVTTRPRLGRRLARHESLARSAGEFEDSALLKAFGASRMGVFPAAERAHDDLVARYGVRHSGAVTTSSNTSTRSAPRRRCITRWSSGCCRRAPDRARRRRSVRSGRAGPCRR
jgi:hypothetical protein